MPRDMRKKESTKLKYVFRVFTISYFRDDFFSFSPARLFEDTAAGVGLARARF